MTEAERKAWNAAIEAAVMVIEGSLPKLRQMARANADLVLALAAAEFIAEDIRSLTKPEAE